jgi:hypothetical protein
LDPNTLGPDDLDLMTRLVVAENNKADPDEQAAIAHVMLNRYASGDFGGSMQDVLNARTKGGGYQFTPLGTTNNSPYKVDPSSPAYQQARQVVEGAAQGSIPDPTNGATYYRNQALAPGKPAGAVGAGTKIGAHTFFTTNSPTSKLATDDDAAQKELLGNAAPPQGGYSSNDDDAAEKELNSISAQKQDIHDRIAQGFNVAATQNVHPMGAAPPASPLARLLGMPDKSLFQTGTSVDISSPEAQNALRARRFFGPVANWAQQNPGQAIGAGAALATAAIPIAGVSGLLTGAAKGVWPIVRQAIPYALGAEAHDIANRGEAVYQYGKNFLNSFSGD